MFSYKKKYDELMLQIEKVENNLSERHTDNIQTDEIWSGLTFLDPFYRPRKKSLTEVLKEIRQDNKELREKIEKIEKDWDKTIDYNEKNNYVVTDLKNDMVNCFFDVKYAKEHIKKLQAKNIPYKVNKKLLKELNK